MADHMQIRGFCARCRLRLVTGGGVDGRASVCGLPSLAIGPTAVVAGSASWQQTVDMDSGHELSALISRLRVSPYVWVRGSVRAAPLAGYDCPALARDTQGL